MYMILQAWPIRGNEEQTYSASAALLQFFVSRFTAH